MPQTTSARPHFNRQGIKTSAASSGAFAWWPGQRQACLWCPGARALHRERTGGRRSSRKSTGGSAPTGRSNPSPGQRPGFSLNLFRPASASSNKHTRGNYPFTPADIPAAKSQRPPPRKEIRTPRRPDAPCGPPRASSEKAPTPPRFHTPTAPATSCSSATG